MITRELLTEKLAALQRDRQLCQNNFYEYCGAIAAVELLLKELDAPTAAPVPAKPQLVESAAKPDIKPDIVSG